MVENQIVVYENWKVYCHINKENSKKYFGITKRENPNVRYGKNGIGYRYCSHFWNAIQKYGWDNFEHIILLENLSNFQAGVMEQYFISKYHTQDKKYGYNIQSGGFVQSDYKHNSDTRQKMRDAWKHRTNQSSAMARSVVCLNTKQRYHSIRDAHKDTGANVGEIAINYNNKNNYAGKIGSEYLRWMWADEYDSSSEEQIEEKLKRKMINKTKTKVICLTTGMIFDSLVEASKYYHINSSKSVMRVCTGGKTLLW